MTNLKDLAYQKSIGALKVHVRRNGIPGKISHRLWCPARRQRIWELCRKLQLWTCPSKSKASSWQCVSWNSRKSGDVAVEKIAIRRNTIKVQRQGSTCHHHSFPWIRTTLLMARGPLEPEAYNMQDINTRMKHSKEQQKYCCNCQYIKKLLPVRPGDHVRVIPGPGSDYITKVVRIIRRWPKNQTKQNGPKSLSHVRFCKCQVNTIWLRKRTCSSNIPGRHTRGVWSTGTPPRSSSWPGKLNHTSRVKGSAPHTTRSGRQVIKTSQTKVLYRNLQGRI